MSDDIATQQPEGADLDEIQDRLTAGDLDGADAALAALPSALEQSTRVKLLQTRLKLAQGDTAQAAEIAAEHLVHRADNNPWVWSQCITTFAADSQMDKARKLFLEGVATAHAANEQVCVAGLDAILRKTPGQDGKVAVLTAALARVPDARVFQLRLATRHMLGGQPQKALELFAKAEASGPLPPHAERSKTMLYPFIGGYSEAFDKLSAEMTEKHATSAHLRRMARYATAAHRHRDASDVLNLAFKRFPQDWLVVYRLVRSKLSKAQRRNVLRRLYALRGKTTPEAAWLLQLAVLALQAGDTDRAREALDAVDSLSAVGWTARALSGALAAAGQIGPADKALQANGEIVEVARPNAVGTVIVFANMTSGIELLPLPYIDGLLSDLPLNVIYLRDFSGLMFQQGLKTCGAGDAALHEHLNARCAELRGPVLTIGNSFGVNAALRAAMALKNASVLSFAGVLDLAESLENSNSMTSHGAWEMKNAGPLVDLLEPLRARPDLQLTHLFGATFEPDIGRAKRMEDLPNCTLRPIEDVGHHYAAMECIARDEFIPLVRANFGI